MPRNLVRLEGLKVVGSSGAAQRFDTLERRDRHRLHLLINGELRATDEIVYDLTVEPTHTFFAGGVLVHNKEPVNRGCQSP